MGTWKKMAGAASAIILAASLSACSANAGANTKCADFNKMSSDDQSKVIQQLLKDKGESNPSVLKVGTYKLSAKGYCAIKSSDSTLTGLSG
ncbi:hypothetical protein SCMU_29520 [Sinomonas cyclohexanicum]|uniref:Lipoprotein n=1 Tax=Sinomonas cyclohexanicum TaxID=322009 RepID=A0ABM7PXS1_SINCY|nr:hypothetical protein [Corynebacterium cyclohexanicum]BCT77110.1 hypothetical protein SCMU_29520 [Corynebacterium cyclohexanicum]